MGFCLLPRRAMARRGLIAALLRPSQSQSFPAPPFHLLSRSYSNKLFVGGLSFRTDEDAVRRAFAQHGEVVEVKLISDRESGRPKGFGFITFESEADAETARSKMTGQVLDGRVIRVDKATSSRPPLPSSSYGSGGGSFSGMSSSPISSSLPPVAEDWGAIPSNIVNIGAGASSSSPAAPATNGTGFGSDSTKSFDSSSFGQAAASWPASTTPAPPSSTRAPTSSFDSSTFGSTTSFNSNTFGSATSFNNSTFGSAAPASSNGSGAAWPGSAPASPSSTPALPSSMPAPVSSIPASGSTVSNVGAQSSSFNSGSLGSAAAAPSTNATKSFDSTTFSATSFGSSTFGSASLNASTFGSASVSTNTSTVNASSTTVSSSSSSTASNSVPEAIIIESNTTTVTSTTSTIASSAASGTADASKPLESGVVSTSTTTTPTPSSAHPLSSPALTSSGTFDFSNFSFNSSSSYRDNDPPLPRRRPRPRPRPASQSMSSDLNFNSSSSSLLETRSPFGSNNQFAETSIPKPKGTETDFGLLNITAPCPPGLRPQGVFDIYLPDDLPEIPPPEPKPKPKPMSLSMFPHRQLPALDLPYHTPEADNWSEIGEDPPKYDLSTLFPSMGELIKKDKEFHWDPFDFDAEATLPPEEEVIVIDSDYD